MINMSTYKFRFNVEGGEFVEMELSKDGFESLSKFCDKHLSDNNWKTKTVNELS